MSLDLKPTYIETKSIIKLDLKEIYEYRDLIYSLVKKELLVQYKQTILGPLWFILQPIIYTIVFNFVFGKIAKLPTDGVPSFLFYLCGMVCWLFFSATLTNVSNAFIGNLNLFTKIYFPRIIVVISSVIVNCFQFFLQLSIFLFFYIFYIFKGLSVDTNFLYLLLLPIIFLQIIMLSSGVGMILASITAKYRDLRFALGMFIQLWLFATPIVYPLSSVPEKYELFYFLNPMTSIIEIFKKIFFNTSILDLNMFFVSLIISFFLLILGIKSFNKTQKNFIDTV